MSFETYLEGRGLSPSTIRTYARTARAIERETDPGLSPGERASAFYAKRVNASASAGTRSYVRGACSSWCSFQGVAWKPPKLNPRRTTQTLAPEVLDEDQLAAYFDAVSESGIPEPVYTILLLLPRTGLRIEEMCSLPADAIQTRRGHKGIALVGKRNKARWIPLGKEAREVLAEYRQPNSPWLFPGRKGQSISQHTVRHHLRKLQRDVLHGFPPLHPHMLRHTFATRTLERTSANLADVQSLLGHTNISTTQRYLHPSVDRLADVVEDL